MNEEDALLEKLEKFQDRFLAMRDHFGLGDNIGFASLPKAHGVYSVGMLVDVYETGEGMISYPNVIGGFFPEYEMLPESEKRRLIVTPNFDRGGVCVVSIYQRKGWWEGRIFEPRVLEIPDLALEGVIAHEFAHVVKENDNLPDRIKDVLKQREADFIELVKNNTADEHWVSTDGDADIDIVAALFGFKDAVLKKLGYMMECLKTYQGPDEDFQLVTPRQALKQMKFRKQEILRYCKKSKNFINISPLLSK